MDSYRQTPIFTINDFVDFNGKTCMITNISNKLGFNQFDIVDVDTGCRHRVARYQLKPTEVTAAILSEEILTEIVSENANDTRDEAEISAKSDPTPSTSATVRFAKVTEKDINSLAENRHSGSTSHQTKWAAKIFRDWLASQEEPTNFELDSPDILALKLRAFYASVRNGSGEEYGKSSLVNIRAGLNRHLTSPPHNRTFNLMHDREFQAANQVFVGLLRKMRQEGKSEVKHKDAITKDDMQKLYTSGTLSCENPEALMYKVYLETSLQFCRRGREGLRELRKNSFVEKNDENGRAYITMKYVELEKNHQGISKKDDYIQSPRMYEQPGDDKCPVKSFRLYLSKLNKNCDAFFQKPNSNYQNSGLWYCNIPVGKNTLATFMPKISLKAKLSKRYTNHCLRVSAIDILDKHGVEAKDICTVTRHKNAESLKSYSKGPSDQKRYTMSDMLHQHGKNHSLVPAHTIPSVSTPLHPTPAQMSTRVLLQPSQAMAQPTQTLQPAQMTTRAPLQPSQALAQPVQALQRPSSQPTQATLQSINTATTNQLQHSMFAGAHFMTGSAPVFNFYGNINFN